ncbi:hypothetical protein P7K49_009081 [Saguinus oedipus]|uniref:Uncharacterized protein n=1 Tax=Saguinus oedipus TaxID=9490 RepID=A0ABQ9VZJ1_SAGOE|nr:hypothetical protein P7K49_009081 [Saguinus oedipus]
MEPAQEASSGLHAWAGGDSFPRQHSPKEGLGRGEANRQNSISERPDISFVPAMQQVEYALEQKTSGRIWLSSLP